VKEKGDPSVSLNNSQEKGSPRGRTP